MKLTAGLKRIRYRIWLMWLRKRCVINPKDIITAPTPPLTYRPVDNKFHLTPAENEKVVYEIIKWYRTPQTVNVSPVGTIDIQYDLLEKIIYDATGKKMEDIGMRIKEIMLPAGKSFTFMLDTTCEICNHIIGVDVPCKPVVNYDGETGWSHVKCLEMQRK
jgi:hypothetical protein